MAGSEGYSAEDFRATARVIEICRRAGHRYFAADGVMGELLAALKLAADAREERDHRPDQCPRCLAPIKDGLYHNDAMLTAIAEANAKADAAAVKFLRADCSEEGDTFANAIKRGEHRRPS